MVSLFLRIEETCLDRIVSSIVPGRHFSLKSASNLNLVEESLLGSGGYGEVHAVRQQKTGQLYAMKTLTRPGVHRDHLRYYETFKRELHAMHRVRHHHCVELIASCTDMNSLMLICSPVADADLSSFLDSDLSDEGERH